MKKHLYLLISLFSFSLFAMEASKSIQQKLEEAIKEYNLMTCQILLQELGANANALNEEGLSPLHIALQMKTAFETHATNHEILRFLLQNGAQPETFSRQIKLTFGPQVTKSLGKKLQTALHIAAQNQCKECCNILVTFLIERMTPDEQHEIIAGTRNLGNKATQDVVEKVTKLIKLEKIINELIPLLQTKDYKGMTPIDYAPSLNDLHPKLWRKLVKKHQIIKDNN